MKIVVSRMPLICLVGGYYTMRGPMRLPRLAAPIILLVLVAISIAYFAIDRQPEAIIRASGTVEATDVDVSFEIAGRVTDVLVAEGQSVKTTDILERLSADEDND